MFRFTIRELLILTVTAGLAVGWWVENRRVSQLQRDNFMLRLSSEQMREAIEIMEAREEAVAKNLPRMEPIYAEHNTPSPEIESGVHMLIGSNDEK